MPRIGKAATLTTSMCPGTGRLPLLAGPNAGRRLHPVSAAFSGAMFIQPEAGRFSPFVQPEAGRWSPFIRPEAGKRGP
jgi:hypothetical protein